MKDPATSAKFKASLRSSQDKQHEWNEKILKLEKNKNGRLGIASASDGRASDSGAGTNKKRKRDEVDADVAGTWSGADALMDGRDAEPGPAVDDSGDTDEPGPLRRKGKDDKVFKLDRRFMKIEKFWGIFWPIANLKRKFK